MSFLAGLTSLGQVANEAGEAGNEVRQEKEQRADKTRQLDAQDAYLQLAKQADMRQAESQKQALAAGDLMKVGNRLWSVSKAKFVDAPTPDPMESLKRFVTTLPKEQQPGAQARAQAALEADPGDPKAAIAEVMRYADAQRAETNRREDAAATETHRREDEATRHKEHEDDLTTTREFQRDQRRELEGFQRTMVPYRLQETQGSKGKELTPAAAKIVETTTPTLQQVDRLLGDIDRLGLSNNNQNGYLTGARLKYALGIASPQGTLADDIASLSLGSVVEAGSAMQGTSRSLMALQKALVHTPNPWKDSPMLMRRKLTEIRQRLQDMVSDAQKYGTKGVQPTGAMPGAPIGGSSDSDPLGILGGPQ
jgi:hypothetical protein